jgi:amino acid adenylation domain-containing protein
MAYLLPQLLTSSAARDPDHEAVVFKDQRLSYGELERASNQLARALRGLGVRRGDRVGIYLAKSPASLVSIYGILKTGAAYVPIDPGAPTRRLAYIVGNCGIRCLITSNDRLGRLRQAFPEPAALETLLVADWDAPREAAAPAGARLVAWSPALAAESDAAVPLEGIDTDLAYILYTSGSTGEPKGVMLSHRNALTFVDWARERFAVTAADRLSSHAPLHFDLSIFDVFVAAAAGATLVLVPAETTLFPLPQAQLMAEARITVWYSVPSALILMLTHLDLRELPLDQLRLILFAGEVFPVKYLRQLHEALPRARLANLYGPTETNVCTYYEVEDVPADRTEPFPIGRACENTEVFALDEAGRLCGVGEVGELYVRGLTVMQGYWGRPEDTARVLAQNPLQPHFTDLVYRTGDLVKLDASGDYLFLGRRDNQIKSRGFRIELGEIETALYNHPAVREAAAVAIPDEQIGNRIHAYVALHEAGAATASDLERHCIAALPRYMVPEQITLRPTLPKTSTGKIDRRGLVAEPTAASGASAGSPGSSGGS